MKSRLIPVVITAAVTSFLTFFAVAHFSGKDVFNSAGTVQMPVNYARYTSGTVTASTPPADFQPAAEAAVEAVVHVKTKTAGREVVFKRQSFWGDFYERGFQPPQMGAGSGVVISPEGYVVTNNHVVANADVVTVTFNDRHTADAKVVATDPSTDIAVLKIEEKNLPYMEFGNSDDVKLGQWVLAVGYPLTLDATVTAGIVSAKGRSLGINRTQSATAIESFIQTDAAVNPGNSGGPLVNTMGQLIGINSAIASPTGSYAGYSYAIPSNIVKKVVEDMIDYGAVQRAYLGISYKDIKTSTPEEIEQYGLDKNAGVYVAYTFENSAAAKAGLKTGDFITAVNGTAVHTSPELLEQIALHKPGDNVSISYTRNGKPINTTVQLKNIEGNTKIIKSEAAKVLGADMRTVSNDEIKKYGIEGGVLVTDITQGLISAQTAMKKNFIITHVNEEPVRSVEQFQNVVASSNGKVQMAGIYPGVDGRYFYGVQLQ